MALCWQKRAPNGNIMRAAQELAVNAEFPAGFRLSITSLPPEEAMNVQRAPDGAVSRYATGAILVYQDRDEDGRLSRQPIDINAVGASDRVVGALGGISLVYLEGGASPHARGAPRPGFNLRRDPKYVDPTPGQEPCEPTLQAPGEYLPLSTNLQISLTPAPELPSAVCALASTAALEDAGRAPLGTAPASSDAQDGGGGADLIPPNAEVACSSDRRSFVSKSCHERGLCGGSSCEFRCRHLAEAHHAPADWPCP